MHAKIFFLKTNKKHYNVVVFNALFKNCTGRNAKAGERRGERKGGGEDEGDRRKKEKAHGVGGGAERS